MLATGVVLVAAGLTAWALSARHDRGRVQTAPEQPATATDIALGPANNSPVLVVDPTDARFVVLANRLDAPDFSCALQVSGDGGATWTPALGAPSLPAGAEKCYAPEVAFDRHGLLYLLFVGLAGGGNRPMGVFLTTSADRGRTFKTPHQVLGPLNFSVRMAIDPSVGPKGRIQLVWLRATSDISLGGFGSGPNPILAASSDDGGDRFSPPVQVSDPARQRVVAPALALGPNHTVTVAYYDLGNDARDYQGLEGPTWDGTWSLVMAASGDGGRTFGAGHVVDDSVTPAERVMLIYTMPPPALVAIGTTKACAAWTDARYGDADVLLRCSTDGGVSWRPPLRINDDRRGNGARQYLPHLSVAPGGRIDAIFLDRRADPENARNDTWYTSSSDGGKHFSTNVRLSRSSSDSRIGQQYAGVAAAGQVEIGSRLGLLSRRGGFVAAWPDTRNSRFSTVEQDIFATVGRVSSTRGWRSWARAAGVLLVAVGLLIVAVRLVWLATRRPAEARS